ncbi:MAG TPA: SRPBCC family protein [Chitinivibrionales bacterium]|nr:SRPBCC family protein [Chitinivibrionales bacterium]
MKKYIGFLSVAVLAAVLVLCGCMNTYVFSSRIAIAAMPSRIFGVVTDFENYPKLCPEFHKQVNIVSKAREGKGVVFETISEFKGFISRSRWEAVEWEKDKMLRLENPTYGTIIILINQIDYNTSEETMIVVTKIPDNYKNEIFGIYEKEMKAVKEKSEQAQ